LSKEILKNTIKPAKPPSGQAGHDHHVLPAIPNLKIIAANMKKRIEKRVFQSENDETSW
jgi:hypothetical protein